MLIWRIFVCVAILGFAFSPAAADFIAVRTDVQDEKPEAVVLQQGDDLIQIEYRLPGIDLLEGTLDGRRWDRVEIPGGGYEQEIGAPEVPHFTRLLIIPARTGVRAEFEALETTTLQDVNLMPAQGVDPADLAELKQDTHFDMSAYSRDAFYPERRVIVGEPAVMRGLRMVTLQANPIQYNPVTRELRITHRFRVTVHFEGTDLRNVPLRQIPLSKAWANMLRSQTLNLDDNLVDEQNMGSYLIVCSNNTTLLNNLQPFVDWKRRKGHSVSILTFTPGSSNTTIKNLIQNVYNTSPVPPEYVLLFGDTSGDYTLPCWSYSGGNIDHPYSQLDGSDILADVALGRMPATDATKTQVMINKVLFYEKMPYIDNTDWYHQSVLLAGSSYSGISTIQTNRWIKSRMLKNGFTRIDTLWYTMGGSVPTVLSNAINNGVTFANYRGYIGVSGFGNSNIDALTNGRKLPFCTIITCGTGGFNSTESLMEHFFSVGTPTTPKGAVACIGIATSSTTTRHNNSLDVGIYAGIYDEGITQAATSMNRGKLELYNAYNYNDPSHTANFSNWLALAGDPGLELFSSAIQFMNCNVPDNIPYGQNELTLTVNMAGGGPLVGATVCYYKADEMQSVGTTNELGQVTLPISVNAPGNVKVTITKHNFYPIVDSLNVIQSDVAVGYYSHTIDDDNQGGSTGDNDGIINPGETVQIPTVFKNYGNATTATGVSVTASETDPYVTLSSATQTFPNLAPGATGNSSGSFLLNIAPDTPHGHPIQLNLVTTSSQGTWTGVLDLSVASYDMLITSAYASGTDTLLSPGETANFILNIRNLGGKNANSLTATITSLSPYVTVNDNSAGFGTINAGSAGNCASNPFNLTAVTNTPPGYPAKLLVEFNANGAVQTDTVTIKLGTRTAADPQGPDGYGYYCYDNTDANYPLHPTYSWVEIDPGYGGSGTQLPLNDGGENQDVSVVMNLPFTFRYYGSPVTQITVCSNGWIATEPDASYSDFRNHPIPSAIGPTGQIAAFWDDLITNPGHVFAWSDVANHRIVIQWSRMKNMGGTFQQNFEIILYDPAYYPTATGDGPILFQYQAIQEYYGPSDDNPYSTVGIENPNRQDGIQIVYWNTYHDPAAATLQNGRAYLFTTSFQYAPPGSNVSILLTPLNPPIQIPASGGSFNFNVAITNNGTSPASFAAWIMQLLPGGSWQGPMLGPVNLTMPASYTIQRQRTQNVPSTAPAGTYTYRGYVGIYSNVKWDSSSFNYTKLSTGDGALVTNWDNTGESFDEWLTDPSSSLAASDLPATFALHSAYPNPFNPRVTLNYDLPQNSRVTLEVFDLMGRKVATLVDGEIAAGTHQLNWDASHLASGMYLLRMEAGSFQATQKLVLLK
jgi:hypothetical protein